MCFERVSRIVICGDNSLTPSKLKCAARIAGCSAYLGRALYLPCLNRRNQATIRRMPTHDHIGRERHRFVACAAAIVKCDRSLVVWTAVVFGIARLAQQR